ncbi:MAG TPA: DUF488 family protein [Acidimicrobiales bacterium]|nr:DUF488 family protein [Acidimicrobiales bacterium]
MAAAEPRRVYDDRTGRPGEYRVLVDRLWPRGVAKASLRLDRWAKDLAPSTELRKWYGHEPERFDEFRRRYLAELGQTDTRARLTELLRSVPENALLVLLTATRDLERSGAAVLAQRLRRRR